MPRCQRGLKRSLQKQLAQLDDRQGFLERQLAAATHATGLEVPDKFSGEGDLLAWDWCCEMDDYLDCLDIEDPAAVNTAVCFLTGPAREWWADNPPFCSWQDLRQALQQQFSTPVVLLDVYGRDYTVYVERIIATEHRRAYGQRGGRPKLWLLCKWADEDWNQCSEIRMQPCLTRLLDDFRRRGVDPADLERAGLPL